MASAHRALPKPVFVHCKMIRSFLIVLALCITIAAPAHDFDGDWQCISNTRYFSGMGHESADPIESYAAIENLQISRNTIYIFEYPCQYMGSRSLYQSEGTWMYKNAQDDYKVLDLKNDTLTITDLFSLGGTTKIYVRDTLDPEITKSLIAGKLNPTCITGDWYVVYSESCCYGSFMEYKYPYALEDTIHLDSAIGSTCYSGGKYVMIKVDGVNLECSVDCSYDFVVEREALRLTPINSKKGSVEILYRRCEME